MKIKAMCLLILGRKIVAKVDKTTITLPGGDVNEATAQDELKNLIKDQCGVVSTKPVLILQDKTEKKSLYIAYVNSKESAKPKSDSKLDTGDWGLHYADMLKTDIEDRYKTDKPFYQLLSIAMSLIKLIMDKKPPSQKTLKDHFTKVAVLFQAITA